MSELIKIYQCPFLITLLFERDTILGLNPLIAPTPPAIHLTQIHAPTPILQFIHQQPEHIIGLPHHIGLHQFGPGPASLGNYK